MRFTFLPNLLLLAICVGGSAVANAQESKRTITVVESGTVTLKPNRLTFSVNILAKAETLKEAKAEYDKLNSAFASSFNVMKFKGLSLGSSTKTVTSQPELIAAMGGGVFGGGGFAFGDAEMLEEGDVYISESVPVNIDGIDKLSPEELDAMVLKFDALVKKIGVKSPMVYSTAHSNAAKNKQLAYADAVKKARVSAKTLAGLAEGKLGRIVSITEALTDMEAFPWSYEYGYDPSMTNGMQSEVEVTVQLKIVFELKD